ncbi:MAG: Gfo/Idh/MocA family oxidoreductase [Pseudomonadota bacterium]
MSDLRVACVGAGYFSQFHYDAWARIEGAHLVASVDKDIARARSTGLHAYADLPQMLSAESVDIVDIITPPPSHLDCITQTLTARPKAIICQKPFCQSQSEAQEATARAEAAGVPLIIHENFRFQPWYRKIKSIIDAGDLGRVLQLTFRLRPGDGQGPRAYLDRQPYFQQMPRFLVHETAVHFLDTFRYLLGAPTSVFADLRRMNPAIVGEDAGLVLFAYPDGRRAMFDGNRLLDHGAKNTRCTMGEALIEGTRATLTLEGDGSVHLRRFGEMETEECLGPSTFPGFGGDCVFALQSHVVDALQRGKPFENLASAYLWVLDAEEAVYRSSETGQWVELT